MDPLPKEPAHAAVGGFHTTHWSVVVSAQGEPSPEADLALERLCRAYWQPIYLFIRRRGQTPENAQDLTQEFFARLLSHRLIDRVEPCRGRFRSWLLAVLQHFLLHDYERASAQKRGGGVLHLPFEELEGSPLSASTAATPLSPEFQFDSRWAASVLDHALDQLKAESAAAGKATLFASLLPYLTGIDDRLPYATLAPRLGLSEAALKMAIHRLRTRYGELLRKEIAQTVATPGEVKEEIRYLLSILAQAKN